MGKFNDLLIEIGVDTSSARKSIKEMDKMFDGLGKSFVGATRKVNSTTTKSAKQSAGVFKEELGNIKKVESARIKQAATQNKLSNKSAKSSASVFKVEFDRVDKLTAEYDKMFKDKEMADKVAHDKSRQRFIDKQQRRAKLRQQTAKDEDKANTEAQKSLNRRLAGYKKEKKAVAAINSAKMKRQNRANSYEENFRTSRAYQGMNDKQRSGMEGKIRQAKTEFILTGNTRAFKMLSKDAARFRQELRKLNVVQSGLNDSTRNMIRSYASLFALMEGTNAIKNIGMDFQGMEASMLAATGGEKEAAKDMQFLNGMVDKMGLNLKDTTDAWVKFKFAANGKIDQSQMEDIFTGLSMFGTSLKVDTESMKRSQKAIIQIRNCLAA